MRSILRSSGNAVKSLLGSRSGGLTPFESASDDAICRGKISSGSTAEVENDWLSTLHLIEDSISYVDQLSGSELQIHAFARSCAVAPPRLGMVEALSDHDCVRRFHP